MNAAGKSGMEGNPEVNGNNGSKVDYSWVNKKPAHFERVSLRWCPVPDQNRTSLFRLSITYRNKRSLKMIEGMQV
jgi:hypothetical protein